MYLQFLTETEKHDKKYETDVRIILFIIVSVSEEFIFFFLPHTYPYQNFQFMIKGTRYLASRLHVSLGKAYKIYDCLFSHVTVFFNDSTINYEHFIDSKKVTKISFES